MLLLKKITIGWIQNYTVSKEINGRLQRKESKSTP